MAACRCRPRSPRPTTKSPRWCRAKRIWVYKALAEWRDLNAAQTEREYVNGQSFLYLGSHYRLQIVDAAASPLILKNGYFLLRRDKLSDAREQFKAFYRQKGHERIPDTPETLPAHARRGSARHPCHGAGPPLGVMLDADGTLNFHWRAMLLPLNVLDYIVVHELAHRIEPTHSRRFWELVERVLPNYERAMSWLRQHGAGAGL
jgi:predicted metal-dependent hydrolase